MSKTWKFVEKEDVQFVTSVFGRRFENEWLRIYLSGTITVKGSNCNGYAWDGCTPKRKFIDLYLGVPDGVNIKGTNNPKTYRASMLHDVLYQFKKDIPISRKEADKAFLKYMRLDGFKLAKLYYIAVRLFGWTMGKWKTK